MNEDPLKHEKQLAAFGCFLIGMVIIFFILNLSGCKSNMPAIDVSFWAGDSAKNGVSRSQDNETLECIDPKFDNYACLTYEDLKKIYDTMLECKQWPTLITLKQSKRLYKKNSGVIQHVLFQRSEILEPLSR